MDSAFRPRADIEPLYDYKENTRRIVWRENPHRKMTIETYQENFQILHDEEIFQPFDPYTDVFFYFHHYFIRRNYQGLDTCYSSTFEN